MYADQLELLQAQLDHDGPCLVVPARDPGLELVQLNDLLVGQEAGLLLVRRTAVYLSIILDGSADAVPVDCCRGLLALLEPHLERLHDCDGVLFHFLGRAAIEAKEPYQSVRRDRVVVHLD